MDFGADRPTAARVGSACADDVFTRRGAFFLQKEVQVEEVLAFEADEVPRVELRGAKMLGAGNCMGGEDELTNLREDKDYRSWLLNFHQELCVEIARNPGDVDAGPLLRDGPPLIKQARALQVRKVTKHVIEGHPKYAVVTKAVVKLLQPVRRPLL